MHIERPFYTSNRNERPLQESKNIVFGGFLSYPILLFCLLFNTTESTDATKNLLSYFLLMEFSVLQP